MGTLVRACVRLIKASPQEGADTPTWLATRQKVAGESGNLWASRRDLPCADRDPEAVERLWKLCDTMLIRPASSAREKCQVRQAVRQLGSPRSSVPSSTLPGRHRRHSRVFRVGIRELCHPASGFYPPHLSWHSPCLTPTRVL